MKKPATSCAAIALVALTITFVILKLTHLVAWSWWIVLLPLWGSFVMTVLAILFIGLIMVDLAIAEERRKREHKPEAFEEKK